MVSKAVCKEAMPEQGITDAMLCAGGEKNKDSCQVTTYDSDSDDHSSNAG